MAKKFFDKETEAGRENRRQRSKALKTYYATPQGMEMAKARGPKVSIALRSYYDKSTEEGKANKRKKSTEAKAREDPSNPNAKANIQHRLSASEIGNATKKADAVAVAAFLEAHVQKEHFGTMPAFLLTTWLSTMHGANPTKLQELKKKYCILAKHDTAKYTTLVISLQPPDLETHANRHLHHDIKNTALSRTVITMRAQGHECGCDKAEQLGRILSYLYWKDKERIKVCKTKKTKRKRNENDPGDLFHSLLIVDWCFMRSRMAM